MKSNDPRSLKSRKEHSRHLFNRIAGRYDLLNRLLSFRRDVGWRRAMVGRIPPHSHVLDLACGTGDVLLELRRRPDAGFAVGLDPAINMLGIAQRKGRALNLPLVGGDGLRLPFRSRSFDAVTIAFGIRNIADLEAAFSEMRRVLKVGGRLLILEFSQPEKRFLRAAYLGYLRFLLPLIGGLVSGEPDAYRYLDVTVETFPYGDSFCLMLRSAGFEEVQRQPLTFGAATLYSAVNLD